MEFSEHTFSSLDILEPHIRKEIGSAHREYHYQADWGQYTADQLLKLGQVLSRSPEFDHQLDAGWVFVELSMATDNPVQTQNNLKQSEKIWGIVQAHAPSAELYFKARYYASYLRSFKEISRNDPVNTAGLLKRLKGVNDAVVGLDDDTKHDHRLHGLAMEIAVSTLLTRHGLLQETGLIAWPATPWQDSGQDPARNIDIQLGTTITDSFTVFQIKSSIDQANSVRQSSHEQDGDDLLEAWLEEYSYGTNLIFGDVHLRNPYDDRYRVNRLLSKLNSPAFQGVLDTITANVLEECENVSWE